MLRAAISATETEIKGGPLASDLVGVVPKHAIVLDLDYYTPPSDQPFVIQKGKMKDFIRSSWERTKKTAAFVHGRL